MAEGGGSFFAANLDAYRRRKPQCAARLAPPTAADSTLPRESPATHCAIDTLAAKRPAQIVWIGLGNPQWLRRLRREAGPIVLTVIEPDAKRAAAAFAMADLREDLADPTVFFLAGSTAAALEDDLADVKTALAARGFELAADPAAYPHTGPVFRAIASQLQAIIARESIHLKTRLARGPLAQANLLRNLPLALASRAPDHVRGLFRGVPAIIVAAGPSLDRNAEELRRAKGRALVLCADTALRALPKRDIQPDVVAASDPTPLNLRHFEGVDFPRNAAPAFAPDCYWEIPPKFEGARRGVCLWDRSSRMAFKLREWFGLEAILERPMNVSEAAVRLALTMGCDPILFAGLDLAFAPGGGLSHCAGSANAREIHRELEGGGLPRVTGWDGNELETYPSFILYLEELNRLTEGHRVRWIDCTEGGARKAHCEPMPLRAALDALPDTGLDFGARWDAAPAPGPDWTARAAREYGDARRLIEDHADRLRAIADGRLAGEDAAAEWKAFLTDETVRAWLDHAVFRFLLAEPIERIPPGERDETLRAHAAGAAGAAEEMLNVEIRFPG